MEEQVYKSHPQIMPIQISKDQAINKLLKHNLRIGIPENVDESLTKYNNYCVVDDEINFDAKEKVKLIKMNNKLAYQTLKKRNDELVALVKNSWEEQQASYSPSKRVSFNNYIKGHNGFVEIVLPATRQEWWEQNGICKFKEAYVGDVGTDEYRKFGRIITESINWEKLDQLVNTEINFIKQFMQKHLGTDQGLLGYQLHLDETTPHLHVQLIPIMKKYSKTIDADRYVFSNNKIFGKKFNNFAYHHANYLTKSGFIVRPGVKGGRGLYNAIKFQDIKAKEKTKHEAQLNALINKIKRENKDYHKYKEALKTYEQWQIEIDKVEKYLLLKQLSFTEKKQLEHWLLILKKMQYYETMLRNEQSLGMTLSESERQLEHWKDEMTRNLFIVNPILDKSKEMMKTKI